MVVLTADNMHVKVPPTDAQCMGIWVTTEVCWTEVGPMH